MTTESRPIVVALLGTPDASAATLHGFYDALSSTRRDWQMLHGGPPAESPLRPLVVSHDGRPFSAGNGMCITPDASLAGCPRPDVICVTDLMIPPGTSLAGLYQTEVAWMRDAWESGATLCSACSGALLLARTGLLDGLDATSHWAYCDRLASEYPRTRWHVDRGLVVAGAPDSAS